MTWFRFTWTVFLFFSPNWSTILLIYRLICIIWFSCSYTQSISFSISWDKLKAILLPVYNKLDLTKLTHSSSLLEMSIQPNMWRQPTWILFRAALLQGSTMSSMFHHHFPSIYGGAIFHLNSAVSILSSSTVN